MPYRAEKTGETIQFHLDLDFFTPLVGALTSGKVNSELYCSLPLSTEAYLNKCTCPLLSSQMFMEKCKKGKHKNERHEELSKIMKIKKEIKLVVYISVNLY